jgi:hypothetical protein
MKLPIRFLMQEKSLNPKFGGFAFLLASLLPIW